MKKVNNISEEEILEMGKSRGEILCDNTNCSYEGTGHMRIDSAVFKVNMQGGYYMFDGEGGSISKCPICGKDSLYLY